MRTPEDGSGSALRVFGIDVGPSSLVPPQPPGWAHLVSVRSGAAMLSSGDIRHVLTPDTAVWVPPQRSYVLDLRTRCGLRIIYAAADRCAPRVFGAVRMTALAHALLERMTVRGYLDPNDARDARLLAVTADELDALVPQSPGGALRFPQSAALRAAIESATTQTDERLPMVALATLAGMPLRTFERRFAAETGLSPRAWLRLARLHAATVARETGKSVTQIALESGYASLSAFIAAYRSVYGTTPGHRRLTKPALSEAWLPG